jgi:hypothetical protein
MELRKLTAADGYVLYNGEIVTKEVYLGCNDSPENWKEIPEDEAVSVTGEAGEADYLAALARLGVQ